MILKCNKIEKSFGEKSIINPGSFHVEENEKVALIGLNGAGKSTILKMIVGEIPLDGGNIIFAKDKTVGYLEQHQMIDSEKTIFEEISVAKADIINMEQELRNQERKISTLMGSDLEKELAIYQDNITKFEAQNGYAYKSEIIGVLKGLGFNEDEFDGEIKKLSGGQKTRISLGKLLLSTPDILLLDEPTNHLDMSSISWLENYLLNYKGAVLIVSHDRYFLNKVVKKVVEIEDGNISMYIGNYTQFAEKKEVLRNMKLKEYIKQQNQIKHQKEVIDKLKSFNREKSIKRAESREKLLSKIDVIDKPIEERKKIHFRLEPNILSGNDVLFVKNVEKKFEKKLLFDEINLDIKRGERVAIIGENGTGKSTFLKIINSMILPSKGEVNLGMNVNIGYYDQEYAVLNPQNTIFEEINNEYPTLTGTKVRNTLAAFLFTGDDVYKQIKNLSGGEKGRVSLAKLMLSESNFLVLDEPTNHLDISSKEILENALNDYTGTILYVSHDRYFINQTATRILELKDNDFVDYSGNYDYYIEKRDEINIRNHKKEDSAVNIATKNRDDITGDNTSSVTIELSAKDSWKANKELEAARRKKQNEIKKIEDEIEKLELEDVSLDETLTMEEVYTDLDRCKDISNKKNIIKQNLELLYEKWEQLH